MTRYTVKKFNPILKAWSFYHTTFNMADAYRVHAMLINIGCEASITQEYVKEHD